MSNFATFRLNDLLLNFLLVRVKLRLLHIRLIGQNEFKGQLILVQVVNQIPEQVLVIFAQILQLHLSIQFFGLVSVQTKVIDVFQHTTSRQKTLLEAFVGFLVASDGALAYRDAQLRLIDYFTTEGTAGVNLLFLFAWYFLFVFDRLFQLWRQQLALAVLALFLKLQLYLVVFDKVILVCFIFRL